MKKNKNPLILTTMILGIISLIATLIIFPQLPAQIPTHWNTAGEVNDYGSRSFALFTGALPLLMLLLLFVLPKVDPNKKSYKQHKKSYTLFMLVITLFMIISHWSAILVTLGFNLSIHLIIPIAVGVLFIIIGNYMPQIRPNYTYGIKTPWSLNNEDNWRATHRFGGYSFTLGGLLLIFRAFISNTIMGYICTSGLIFCIFAPMIYSFIYFKNHEGKKL